MLQRSKPFHHVECVTRLRHSSKTIVQVWNFQEHKNQKQEDNQRHYQAFINDKASHANLLYYRWLSGRSKKNFSHRLGISYTETLHARNATSILK